VPINPAQKTGGIDEEGGTSPTALAGTGHHNNLNAWNNSNTF